MLTTGAVLYGPCSVCWDAEQVLQTDTSWLFGLSIMDRLYCQRMTLHWILCMLWVADSVCCS